MKKYVSNVKRVKKNFKTITKTRSIRKEVYKKYLSNKRYQAESADESGSLSYKSRERNKSEESLSGFKLIHFF